MGCYEHQEQLMMPHLLLLYFGDVSTQMGCSQMPGGKSKFFW